MNNKKADKPQTLKGFRDFLPKDLKVRNYVLNTFIKIFQSFGFEELQTPALEYSSTLLDKYGGEADKLVYTFKDKGKRNIGLRYDLTVPVSRVLAQYSSQLIMPLKRYQIQPVWRAEKPQKGRFREFIQCDIDIFGIKSYLADAEIIAVIYQALKKLGFRDFIININSRQVLFQLLDNLGIKDQKQQFNILQSLDKLESLGKSKVENELTAKGLTEKQIKLLWTDLNQSKPDKDLKQLFGFIKNFGIENQYIKFLPSMARGLDYYTGPIYETTIANSSVGSITGGGRYNNLIKQLGGPDIPAAGTTLGFDRICQLIQDKKILTGRIKPTAEVLMINNKKYLEKIIKITKQLRNNSISCELYLKEIAWAKQIKYADKKNIPYVIFLGEDEINQDKISLKNLKTGKQQLLSLKQAILLLKKR
jgi:histidyl-tRNA synthetase